MSLPAARFRVLSRVLAVAILAFSFGARAADAPAPAPAPAGPPPVELFFENAVISGARISPDGQEVALRIGGRGKHYVLAVLHIATLQPTPVAAFQDQDVADFRWVGAHRLVMSVEPTLVGPGRIECGQGLFAVDDDGQGFRKLVESCRSFVKEQSYGRETLPWNTWPIDLASPPDDDTVFAVQPQEFSQDKGLDYFHLLRVNTRTGRDEELEVPLHSRHFVIDHSGRVRAATVIENNQARVLVLDPEGQWKEIDRYDPYVSDGLEPQHIDREGRLFLSGSRKRNTQALYVYDTKQGRLNETPILSSADFDVKPEVLANQDRVLGIRYETDSIETVWLDPGMRAVQAALDKRLPGRVNLIDLPRSAVPDTVLVTSFADRLPRAYYLYDAKADKLTLLGATHSRVDPRQMGKQLFVRYKARDGTSIPAYVTFPPGRERKGLALVVLVHGGPFVRGVTWGWDPEAQFLASRGYAVLQPEYRGSTGFGYEHFHAGWKQWGGRMEEDVADGARWMVSEGLADSGRICIMGASYGGYASLIGLAKDAGLYRCGVAWAAVTDLRLLGSWAWGGGTDLYKRYGLPRLVGDEKEDAEMLRADSPVENAARIRAPLLLAHGTFDATVPIVHGERMRDLLREKNPAFEWIQYDDEPHGWIREETKFDFWRRVEKFLATQLSPQSPPPPPSAPAPAATTAPTGARQ
jgi:dienelactone hydrolase